MTPTLTHGTSALLGLHCPLPLQAKGHREKRSLTLSVVATAREGVLGPEVREAGHFVCGVSTNLIHPQNGAISQISDTFVMVAPLFRSCPCRPALSSELGRKRRAPFDL